MPTVPDAPKPPCPEGTGKELAIDASDWNTSYTPSIKRILRTAAVSLILENHRIINIKQLDPMKDNDPVTVGMKTSALISFGVRTMI